MCTGPLAGRRLWRRREAKTERLSAGCSTLVPDLRGHVMIRRHPVILASIARCTVTGTIEGARQGYRTARSELGEAVPPHAVDAALTAYRDEGRRLVAALCGVELVERALRDKLR
jgi:hypothetical protein